MRFSLERASEYMSKGLTAKAEGRYETARFYFLQAAKHLFKAAAESKGEFKRQRVLQAERLEQWARELEGLERRRQQEVRAPLKSLLAAEDDDALAWLVVERPQVRFSDVAGLDDVKEQIRLRLIYPFQNPERAQRYGVRPGGGILLYGPPGTGKTLIARAVAGEVDAAFFTVKPSEIMSKWVGEAEQNIAKLFEAARRYERAVIFIDEVEALLPKRRGTHSTVMQRVVPQILQELEGFSGRPRNLLFIGATNEPWALDDAAVRPGRFDEKIYVPLPDFPARRRILELNLKDRPLAPEVDLDELARRLEGYSGADVVAVCEKACAAAYRDAMETGVDRLVLWEDFVKALEAVRPSVSPKALKAFEEFRFG
jgi:transitional endoplasmic reticulum ATPase